MWFKSQYLLLNQENVAPRLEFGPKFGPNLAQNLVQEKTIILNSPESGQTHILRIGNIYSTFRGGCLSD